MNEGINELASAVAWWLSHPWRAVGVYLVAQVARIVVAGIFGGVAKVFRTDADRWEAAEAARRKR